MNLIEIIADWDEPEPTNGPGRYYSPRLLLSLISELSFDSRFVAARRPGDATEWRLWASNTFVSQMLAGVFNWVQIHALGALSWGSSKPEFQPMKDPSHVDKVEDVAPEELSVFDIHRKLSASTAGIGR